MADEKTLEKVRKLLAQAENQMGTPEGEAFSARAEELMIRHGIEQDMLDAAQGTNNGKPTSKQVFVPAPYAKEKAGLLCTVATHNSGDAIICKPSRGWSKGCTVYVYAFDRDLDAIEWLFTSLSLQAMNALSNREIPVDRHGRRMDAATFRSGWMLDFRVGVHTRMEQMRRDAEKDAEQEHGGAALVLAEKKSQVEALLKQNVPQTKQMSSRSSGRGRGDGFSAGMNADLGQKRFNRGGSKQLAS